MRFKCLENKPPSREGGFFILWSIKQPSFGGAHCRGDDKLMILMVSEEFSLRVASSSEKTSSSKMGGRDWLTSVSKPSSNNLNASIMVRISPREALIAKIAEENCEISRGPASEACKHHIHGIFQDIIGLGQNFPGVQ